MGEGVTFEPRIRVVTFSTIYIKAFNTAFISYTGGDGRSLALYYTIDEARETQIHQRNIFNLSIIHSN